MRWYFPSTGVRAMHPFLRVLLCAGLAGVATVINPAGPWVLAEFPDAGGFEPLPMAGMVLGHGLCLAWLVTHTSLRGLGLAAWIAALYAAINGLLAQVETLMFLNVWNPVLSLGTVNVLFWHQVAFSVVLGGLVGLAFRAPVEPVELTKLARGGSLAWRFGLAALLYVPVYLIAGALIAVPLGGEAFEAIYRDLDTPSWMPVFQGLRGLGWVAVAWLALRFTVEGTGRAVATSALVLTLPMDAGLLLANPIFPDELRVAHFTEIGVSMAVFGAICGVLLHAGRDQPGV